MNKLLILFLIIFFSNELNSQIFYKAVDNEKYGLQKVISISDTEQLKNLIGTVMSAYGASFKYYKHIKQGDYKFIINGNIVKIQILEDKKVIDNLKIEKIRNSGGNTNFVFNNAQFNSLIDNNKLNQLTDNAECPEVFAIIQTNHMLWDKEILNTEEYLFGKILHKGLTTFYLEDQDDEPLVLFQDATDGIVIPFGYGASSKVITVDNLWNTFVSIDQGNPDLGIRYYGSGGTGNNQFMVPNSVTYGRIKNSIYPIYIADLLNKRIAEVGYKASTGVDEETGFLPNTFNTLIANVPFPYDIVYFKAVDSSNNDKLWVSRSPRMEPRLACYSLNGDELQVLKGYRYVVNNQSYTNSFEPFTSIRMDVYSGVSYNALVFIDNIRNCIVSCRLSETGVADSIISHDGGYVVFAEDVLSFPSNYRLNSVAFQRTNNASDVWTNLWITSGYSDPPFTESSSMVHGFKMNKNVRSQYLGSTSQPYNTDASFTDLTNIIAIHDFKDLFTVEKWNSTRGIRRYWYYADIRCDSVSNYQRYDDINISSSSVDSGGYFSWNRILTNDCNVKFHVEKKVDNIWSDVEIKEIDGDEITDLQPVLFKAAGGETSQIKLNLPLSDLVLGRELRLTVKLYPEYANANSWLHEVVTVTYNFKVDRKDFLPTPGGCPFIYVEKSDSGYRVDNNILHKIEYSADVSYITDKYLIRETPGAIDGFVNIYVVENERDVSTFNKFALYAIDHPVNTKVIITENNDIALYDPKDIVNSDSATLNITNITNKIEYDLGGKFLVKGYNNDSSYVQFPLSLMNKGKTSKNFDGRGGSFDSSTAIIYNMKNFDTINSPSSKNWAGLMKSFQSAGDTVIRSFSRRERSMTGIVPIPMSIFSINNIDFLNINWQSNFKLNFISLVKNVSYNTGFDEQLADFTSASLVTLIEKSTVTSNLIFNDSLTVTMDSLSVISLKFDVSQLHGLSKGYVRDFVFETIGTYFIPGSDNYKYTDINGIPTKYNLFQNYPNPFNPATKINYDIPKTSKVNLVIYDVLGREVIRLVNNELKEAGRYSVEFNGQNYASGVYFYRIETGSFVQAKKMVLVK